MKNFNQIIMLLQKYKEEHGDCLVPQKYITEDGIKLGQIVNGIRSGNRVTSTEEKEALDSLGFVWKTRASTIPFEEIIRHLQKYKEENGDCLVSARYITEDGIGLGQIVHTIRTGIRKTSAKEKAMLDNLGFVWRTNRRRFSFEEVIGFLQRYKEEHGDFLVPDMYVTEDGIRLGRMVRAIRAGKRKISEDEKAILDSLGFVWKINESPLSFEEVIRHLQKYKEEKGDCLVPCRYITEDGIKLGQILLNIRTGSRKTSAEEKSMLDSLGFVWMAGVERKKKA